MLLVASQSLDPYWNLAVEDLLLNEVDRRGPMLFLWRCADTVVIGKNQNPWRECNLAALRKDRGLLARRVSGGGAVYHDEGNLNYAYFCTRKDYREEDVFSWIIEALGSLDLEAVRMGRSGLAVGGQKISGNAFCYRRNAVLHHGTLLHSADLERMDRYLVGRTASFLTHAVESVPAPVVNLVELVPGLTEEQLALAVVEEFARAHGGISGELDADSLDPEAMRPLHARFISEDWILGQTPRFSVVLEEGPLRAELDVVRGIVTGAKINGVLEESLTGVPFEEEQLRARVRDL